MENGNNKTGLLIFIILIAGFWILNDHKEIKKLKEESDYLEYRLTDYRMALEEANSNIEEANSEIEDAQTYTWSSYEEMGNALDSLYTIDTILEP